MAVSAVKKRERRPPPLIDCVSCGQTKPHHARRLCTACYKHHQSAFTLARFPSTREEMSPRARYDAWVASGLMPNEYAHQIGIWNTSLVRALRAERERRERLGLPWLTGWRKARGGNGETERSEYESASKPAGEERSAPAGDHELHREEP